MASISQILILYIAYFFKNLFIKEYYIPYDQPAIFNLQEVYSIVPPELLTLLNELSRKVSFLKSASIRISSLNQFISTLEPTFKSIVVQLKEAYKLSTERRLQYLNDTHLLEIQWYVPFIKNLNVGLDDKYKLQGYFTKGLLILDFDLTITSIHSQGNIMKALQKLKQGEEFINPDHYKTLLQLLYIYSYFGTSMILTQSPAVDVYMLLSSYADQYTEHNVTLGNSVEAPLGVKLEQLRQQLRQQQATAPIRTIFKKIYGNSQLPQTQQKQQDTKQSKSRKKKYVQDWADHKAQLVELIRTNNVSPTSRTIITVLDDSLENIKAIKEKNPGINAIQIDESLNIQDTIQQIQRLLQNTFPITFTYASDVDESRRDGAAAIAAIGAGVGNTRRNIYRMTGGGGGADDDDESGGGGGGGGNSRRNTYTRRDSRL